MSGEMTVGELRKKVGGVKKNKRREGRSSEEECEEGKKGK